MTANVSKLSPKQPGSPAGIPRDFTNTDRELYEQTMAEVSDRTGATESDRRAVIGLVRARRAEQEWREIARGLRKQIRADPSEIVKLMPLASRAEREANAASSEARSLARALLIDTETRGGRRAKDVKGKGVTLDLSEIDFGDEE